MSYEEFLDIVVTEIESTRVLSLPAVNPDAEIPEPTHSDDLIVE